MNPETGLRGLAQDEARRRLQRDGENRLPGNEPVGLGRLVLGVLFEPMFLMLLAAGGIYLVLGSIGEAGFLLTAVAAVIGMTIMQEHRTQRALEALRDLSAPQALVIRGGIEQRIPGCEVVEGDLLVLREGDRVAADALLVEGLVETDESLLTGEAATVPKHAAGPDAALGEPGAEGSAGVFAGTVVTRGTGLAHVRATGPRTAVGRIGLSLGSTMPAPSALQQASRRLVRWIAAVGLALAGGLVLVGWLWDGRAPLQALLAGIALAMAVLPEEIPVVLTVFLALGAWRLARRQVLTRRIAAVEALGAITVLAVDKTGTLTQNRMQVACLQSGDCAWHAGAGAALPEPLHALAEFGVLATPTDPFDPMEKAIRSFGQTHLDGTEHAHPGWVAGQEYGLTPAMLAMTRVFPTSAGAGLVLASKGAPEAIADLCHLDAAQQAELARQVAAMAARGMRVLGVASGHWMGPGLPASQHDFGFRLLGLIGLQDPPRPEVPAAVATCAQAGIRVIMMTGDHPVTAQAIAAQIGLAQGGAALTGPGMSRLDDAALQARLATTSICARMQPEQKLGLVRALQAAGHTVGMTGDGVNDAPALKAADVGIAMGGRGTDVAREAAAIVLLDDSFERIVGAIAQGRRIFDNICGATRFVFAVHIPVIALALVPALLHWPMLLLPTQIVLFELLIDPACSVLFEAEPAVPDLMRRPPRDRWASPFSRRNIAWGALQGAGVACALLAACGWLLLQGLPDEQVRTAGFGILLCGVVLLVLASRGRPSDGARQAFRAMRDNRWILALALGAALVLGLTASLPWLNRIMGLAVPTTLTLAACGVAVLASGLWLLLTRALLARAPEALDGKPD